MRPRRARGLHGAARRRSSSARFAGRILNVHPSLLPAFPGVRAIEQALDYGVKVMGVTVHFVDEGVDTGPIILQEAFELLPILAGSRGRGARPRDRAPAAAAGRPADRRGPRARRPRQPPAAADRRWRARLRAAPDPRRARRGAGPPRAPVGVRQARAGGLRARARRARRRDRLHRRHGARARGRGHRDPARSRTTPASPRSSTGGSRRSTRASTPGCSRCARARSTCDTLDEHEIEPIDLVCVNLYPFERVASRRGVEDARGDREHRHRRAHADPRGGQEPRLRGRGGHARELRRGARRAARERRAAVRAAPARAWRSRRSPTRRATTRRSRAGSPSARRTSPRSTRALREGARPLLRREPAPARGLLRAGGCAHAPAVDGVEAARQGAVVQQPARPRLRAAAGGRVRGAGGGDHQAQQPVRRGRGRAPDEAFEQALATDRQSAFGGVVLLQPARSTARWPSSSTRCSSSWCSRPGYDDDALEVLQQKQNVRILENQERRARRSPSTTSSACAAACWSRTATRASSRATRCRWSPKRKPTEEEWGELLFAMRVCKHVRSNAIVLAKDLATAGIGAGQMSRVDSVRHRRREGARGRHRPHRRGDGLRRLLPVRGRPAGSRSTPACGRSSSRAARSATTRWSTPATRPAWRWSSPPGATSATSAEARRNQAFDNRRTVATVEPPSGRFLP